ncbi:TPA: tail fiber protein, partial [Escherichia coli]
VLIAVANCPETYKPQLQEGSGRTQTIRMILVVTNTEAITLKIDPSVVLATRKYVDDKISEHEQSRRHPDASLTVKGFTQLSSAINSESETLAATPKAVKAAYDLANEKYTAQNATTTQKGIVQLSSATNSTSETLAATPKAVKAVMDETNKKAPLNSPALTGTPTTPTAPQGTNSTQIASTAFVMAAIAALVDSSPDALNTLNELAAALGNDPNFATTMTNALAGKQPKDATLTALAELATSADKLPYFTGADRAALTALTSVGRAILGKTSTQGVLDYLGLGEGSALPVGVPVPWPSATPPTGWLKCNGAAFSAEEYPELAKVYPTNKLPDLRGEFIRGWDDGRGVDAGRQLLSSQGDAIRNIEGFADGGIGMSFDAIRGAFYDAGTRSARMPNNTTDIGKTDDLGFDASRVVPTANENRPRNIAFNYIVRAA